MDEREYISWDEYYMGIAQLVKRRSKDPSTQVGACIVKDNRVVSTGYNGFPSGLSDVVFPWTKGDEDETRNKYYYVVHAELNAILSAKKDLTDATLYVTLFPCNECAKAIIQSGIKKVIYYDEFSGKYTEEKQNKNRAVQTMFDSAGVEYYLYNKQNKQIEIEL